MSWPFLNMRTTIPNSSRRDLEGVTAQATVVDLYLIGLFIAMNQQLRSAGPEDAATDGVGLLGSDLGVV